MTVNCGTVGDIGPRSSTFREYAAMNRTPWHSIKQMIYHNETACAVGNNIQIKNLREGAGGKPLCKECADLTRRGLSAPPSSPSVSGTAPQI